jgi:hypothetical protein
MRSNVAKRIQAETPEEVQIFVRQYTDIVIRINNNSNMTELAEKSKPFKKSGQTRTGTP